MGWTLLGIVEWGGTDKGRRFSSWISWELTEVVVLSWFVESLTDDNIGQLDWGWCGLNIRSVEFLLFWWPWESKGSVWASDDDKWLWESKGSIWASNDDKWPWESKWFVWASDDGKLLINFGREQEASRWKSITSGAIKVVTESWESKGGISHEWELEDTKWLE